LEVFSDFGSNSGCHLNLRARNLHTRNGDPSGERLEVKDLMNTNEQEVEGADATPVGKTISIFPLAGMGVAIKA